MKIVWTEVAVLKLEELADYIAADNPAASLKWTKEIRESVNHLKSFPRIGREVPEVNRSEIREIIEGNYRIIYKLETNRISVLTIRHVRQLFNNKILVEKR